MAVLDSTVLVLDIETRPDPEVMDAAEFWQKKEELIEPDGRLKDPVKIADDLAKKSAQLREGAALSPITGLVAMVGLRLMHTDQNIVVGPEADPTRESEKRVLQALAQWGERPSTIIGFNVVDFDLPFLIARAALHGITIPWLAKPRNYRRVVELRDLFTRGSLSDWRWLFTGKFKEVEGADTLLLPMSDLRRHLEDDLNNTAVLAERTQHIWAGGLS